MVLLGYLRNFQPFRLDALGIVTLLGAEQVNNHVGKLVRSRYLEYMPLLGAYVIASDEFTAKQAGFQLFNFSANICTPSLAGWFSRWLSEQDFETSGTCVEWTINAKAHSFALDIWIALLIGTIFQAGFIVITVLMGDWWGFANAMSMVISTAGRAYLVNRNTTWLDAAIVEETRTALALGEPELLASAKKRPSVNSTVFDKDRLSKLPEAKVMVILPDARAAVLFIPDCLVREIFVYNPKPVGTKDETKRVGTWPVRSRDESRRKQSGSREFLAYELVRWISWLAFGAHVVTIGMSDLVSQLITVVIIVVPTFLIVRGFGCDDRHVGTRLRAEISDIPPEEVKARRADMYAFLHLNEKEEGCLEQWNLAANRANSSFWDDYERKKEVFGRAPNLREIRNYEDRVKAIEAAIVAFRKDHADKAPSPQVRPASSTTSRHTSLDTA
ncbi:uncharacterized protein Z520_06486 [Fonsecaea multimorphosa CBS 102226]|uniref:Uncharacterized protein n=1 Tax=Fonsecaea multimorphosa CBS 102226 TaxID=1442371 RepID=A0A0D2KLY5_9EURO|nr:uncharacterized protein Z520_06486 [Fonsecaea multimorphosa CBS 102226]KIX97708.1 hypothetical protein Z520_06486 [Fonsecaea multimorphosa CBS 102226]OAL23872.1 hypothetical protein AYO22_06048 [Fonsecaea multimorphosa]